MIRVALVLGLVACSVEPRSDSFRCDVTDDCSGDRVCDQGWCVGSGGGECPAVCSECVGGTCVINCPNPNVCDADIICPAGLACEVTCERDNTCAGIEIDCSAATDCQIFCNGAGSCTGPITCPDEGSCTIDCDGENSCSGSINAGAGSATIECGFDACGGGIDCADACSCDIDCQSGCVGPASCPMGDACESGAGGCDNTGQCDTC